jgi:two-component system cell cycle response regulator
MKVLVVDDDPVYRSVVEAMIRASGHECLVARDGLAALAVLQEEDIDVLVTDRQMPGMDGLELCRLVRSDRSTEHVYIILVTGLGSSEQARQGMLAGADDYLVKPSLLVDVQLRLIAAERVTGLHRKIKLANQELRAVARRDPLTNLGNRRSLTEALEVMADRLHRYGQGFSVALLDVDNFKLYNDAFGHQAGDEVLKSVAQVLLANSRTGDTCYRYGGEEFLCVFPDQSAGSARTAIQRIVDGIAKLAIPHAEDAAAPFLTVSVGIAEMGLDNIDAHETVQAADAALYQAKKDGRNRVQLASSPPHRDAPAHPGPADRAAGRVVGALPVAPAIPKLPTAVLAPERLEAPGAQTSAVDLTVLDSLLEQLDDRDGELREDLLASYLDHGPGQVRSLVLAAADADAGTVAATAHMMRSSSALLGATGLADLCHQADEMAQTGTGDLIEIADLIRIEYDQVSAAMTQLVRPVAVLPGPRLAGPGDRHVDVPAGHR